MNVLGDCNVQFHLYMYYQRRFFSGIIKLGFNFSFIRLDSVILLGLYVAYLIMMYFNPAIETFVTSHITTCGLAPRDLARYTKGDKPESLGHSSELESLMRGDEEADDEINANGDSVVINGICKPGLNSKGR